MTIREEAPTIVGGDAIQVFTPGAELFVSFFRITIDLGGRFDRFVRPTAAAELSDAGLAFEADCMK